MNTTTMFSAALLDAAAGGTTGSDISSAITAIFIFFICSGIFFGLTRGMYKTAIRCVTVAAVAILSFYTITYMSQSLHDMLTGHNLEEIIVRIWPGYLDVVDAGIREIIASFDPITVERLLVMAVTIVLIPILFSLVFIVFRLVSMLVYFLLCGLFRARGHKSLGSAILGGALGAVQGAFIAGVILLPIAGMATTIGEMREELIADKRPDVSEQIESIYVEYIDDVLTNPVLEAIRGFGTNDAFADMVTVPVGEEDIDMREEVKVVAEIAGDCVPLFDPDFAWTRLGDDQKMALSAILADVGEDDYTANLVSGVLRGLAKATSSGVVDLGIEAPMDEFIKAFIAIFETSDRNNVTKDLETFLNVYFILSDFEVLKFFDAGENEAGLKVEDLLTEEKDGKTIITHVIDTLSANDRTKSLVTALTKFSLKIMADTVGNILPEGMDAEVLYDGVREGMADVLLDVNNPDIPEEEKKEVVKDTLNQTLVNAGVLTEETPLDDEIMSNIADHVITEFAGKEELTDDDINGAILSYFTKYGTEGIPDGVNPDDLPDGDYGDILDDILGGGNGNDGDDDGNDDGNDDGDNGNIPELPELPEGVNPDDIPEGINPDDIPEGINPDDLEDILGDLIGGGSGNDNGGDNNGGDDNGGDDAADEDEAA